NEAAAVPSAPLFFIESSHYAHLEPFHRRKTRVMTTLGELCALCPLGFASFLQPPSFLQPRSFL
ncbi:hypothetical protein, partial [Olsenella uli]|uniref:hypothetical protein n=1 Tax=Olsenella uli TaxID=133926 RepID=UPI001C9D9A10